MKTSFFHQSFTLIPRASLTFTVFLLILLSTSFWLKLNIAYCGIPAILISLILTHFLLVLAESNLVTLIFSPIRKGKPVVIYRRWLQIENDTLIFGHYRLLWSAIDGISLSHFGNLIFTSRALCGPAILDKKGDKNPASKVLKVPFAPIDLVSQKNFVTILKNKCPQAKISASLTAIIDKPFLKSTNYINAFTMLAFIAVLFDVGYSTFRYVELLKRYYLADKAAVSGDMSQARQEYDAAEQLRTYTPDFSLVSKQLFSKGESVAAIQESRAQALWALGEKEAALSAQETAAKLRPKSFKIVLRQARLSLALGKTQAAKKAIEQLIDKHKHALLPHLYLAALLDQTTDQDRAKAGMEKYLTLLDREYFSPPPVWPPSGEEVLHELFYRDDLHFLFSNTSRSKANR